jgi:hypothetical protein
MSTPQNDEECSIACNFGAIAPEDRLAHATKAEEVFQAVLEIKELADGYAFRLPLENRMLFKVTEWIAKERLCCPFFRFNLSLGQEFWLEILGDAEVKEYIGAIMVKPLQETGNLPNKEEWIAAHS